MRPIAVVDIDGVVADATHRQHLLAGTPTHADWLAFFAQAGDDQLLTAGADLVHHYATTHTIVWLTARPEHFRTLTRQWLDDHGLPAGLLIMKANNDRRPAREYKAEQIRQLQTTNHIAIVIDDDPHVIQRLTTDGIPVHHATWTPPPQTRNLRS